jgi:RNA polymerase sigma-70 factor (ECF subfamily)
VTTDIDRRTRFETIAGVVYEPLQRYLRRRASSDDADDAFSETLLTLWRRLDDIPGDAVLPYAYGVARRVLSNQRRASGRRLRLMERVASSTETTVPGPEDQDTDPEVRAALATLPEADREVLVLWAWEQLEPREIAVVLDTTANAISLRLTRARAKLANALERQDVDGSGHKQVETTEEHRP